MAASTQTGATKPLSPRPGQAKVRPIMTPAASDSAEASSLLRQRPFVLYWAAQMLSSLGFQAQAVTIAWQIYAIAGGAHQDVRHAAFAVGMIGLAQFLPMIALTLPAGELADRH